MRSIPPLPSVQSLTGCVCTTRSPKAPGRDTLTTVMDIRNALKAAGDDAEKLTDLLKALDKEELSRDILKVSNAHTLRPVFLFSRARAASSRRPR